jgi:hypothetical protein
MKRRLRAPSPALVIALIALFVALGGTSFAAINALPKNSVGAKQLKKNAVTGVKIKKGAVTASKINPSGLTVPSATHATSADSATNATNATNATTAANANALGGVAASGYVKNSGTIYVQQGHANWQPFVSTDPVTVTRYTNGQGIFSTTVGSHQFRIDLTIPTSLYGHDLAFTGARICFGANTTSSITEVFVEKETETTGAPGPAPSLLVDDTTHRTGGACLTYSGTSAATLSSSTQISIYLVANWTGSATLYLGSVTAILQPTSTVASLRKSAGSGKLTPGVGGTAPR